MTAYPKFSELDDIDNLSLEKLRMIAYGADDWILEHLESSIFDVDIVRVAMAMGRHYALRLEEQIEGPLQTENRWSHG